MRLSRRFFSSFFSFMKTNDEGRSNKWTQKKDEQKWLDRMRREEAISGLIIYSRWLGRVSHVIGLGFAKNHCKSSLENLNSHELKILADDKLHSQCLSISCFLLPTAVFEFLCALATITCNDLNRLQLWVLHSVAVFARRSSSIPRLGSSYRVAINILLFVERFCSLWARSRYQKCVLWGCFLSYFQPRFKPSSRHSRNVINSGIMMSQEDEFQVLVSLSRLGFVMFCVA